jgi:hypothetical protein
LPAKDASPPGPKTAPTAAPPISDALGGLSNYLPINAGSKIQPAAKGPAPSGFGENLATADISVVSLKSITDRATLTVKQSNMFLFVDLGEISGKFTTKAEHCLSVIDPICLKQG